MINPLYVQKQNLFANILANYTTTDNYRHLNICTCADYPVSVSPLLGLDDNQPFFDKVKASCKCEISNSEANELNGFEKKARTNYNKKKRIHETIYRYSKTIGNIAIIVTPLHRLLTVEFCPGHVLYRTNEFHITAPEMYHCFEKVNRILQEEMNGFLIPELKDFSITRIDVAQNLFLNPMCSEVSSFDFFEKLSKIKFPHAKINDIHYTDDDKKNICYLNFCNKSQSVIIYRKDIEMKVKGKVRRSKFPSIRIEQQFKGRKLGNLFLAGDRHIKDFFKVFSELTNLFWKMYKRIGLPQLLQVRGQPLFIPQRNLFSGQGFTEAKEREKELCPITIHIFLLKNSNQVDLNAKTAQYNSTFLLNMNYRIFSGVPP